MKTFKLYVMLAFSMLLSATGYAATKWVSPTGAATWANCGGESPLSGTDACPMSTAISSVAAGDTVYLRGGDYDRGILLIDKNGTAENKIIFQNHTGETPVIKNTTYAYWSGRYHGLLLAYSDYIKISGITFEHTSGDYFMQVIYGSSYNEIENCIFDGKSTYGVVNMWKGSSAGSESDASKYNWIHGNTFKNYGVVGTDCDDLGGFQVGTVSYDNVSGYNTLEDNTFYGGGHHNLETFTKYNVIRNNFFYFHGMMEKPEASCTYGPDSNDLYGNRNIQIYDGLDQDGMFNLLEGNRFGPSGPPPDDDGGDGMTITAPKNIIRYNEVYSAQNNGVFFKHGSASYSNYNRFYNNTITKSGRYDNTGPQWTGSNLRDPGRYQSQNIVTIEGTDGTVTFTVGIAAFWYNGSVVTIAGTANYNGSYVVTRVDSTTFTFTKSGTSAQETTGTARGTGPTVGNVVTNNIFYEYGSGSADFGVFSTSQQTHANNLCTDANAACTVVGDPVFLIGTFPEITTTPNKTQPNLALATGSPAINAGTYLTQVNDADGCDADTAVCTDMVVDDALYFQDGTWGSSLASLSPDEICISASADATDLARCRTISSINYATNTITLASEITFANNEYVWLYKKSDGVQVLIGTKPDIGAHEYNSGSVYTLTVSKAGSGTGTVTSDVTGIDCGATCEYDYDGTVVTLTATATLPNYLSAWSGEGCSGTSTCQVTMSAAKSVTATFSRYGTATIGSGGSMTIGSGGSLTLQ